MGRPVSDAVLQVVTSDDRRGAEVFAVGLATELELAGRRVQTVALAPGSSGGLTVPTLGSTSRAPATLLALRRRARSAGVVVAHGADSLAACGLALAGLRVDFVYRSIGDPAYWAATPARRARVRALLHRARMIVVLWPGAARTLVTRFGVPEAKVVVVPNAVPVERFPPVTALERTVARATLGLAPDVALAAYVGALSREKSVGTAIAALAHMPHVHLLVAGAGSEAARLRQAGDQLAPGRVHFLGSVTDTRQVLAAADIVVLPSLTEGIPAVLIEAGLSGLPVVASDVGGVRQVVRPGQTGLLVPPGQPEALASAVRAALTDPRLGQAAREHCLATFDLRTTARDWGAILDAVMDGERPPAPRPSGPASG